MKLLRHLIKEIIIENCNKRSYWGIGGAGFIVLCIEDKSIYLQQRSWEVSGGAGQWGFPGGGIHLPEKEKFHNTPINSEFILNDNDPIFRETAFLELTEEAGLNSIPSYEIIDELISYEDCGFKFKTFIINISKHEKQRWSPYPLPSSEWEIGDQDWFPGHSWQQEDIYFGFTPILIQKINNYIN